MSIPKDPIMRLSYINTLLRDHYKNLDELCDELSSQGDSISVEELIGSLSVIDYHYDSQKNQFT